VTAVTVVISEVGGVFKVLVAAVKVYCTVSSAIIILVHTDEHSCMISNLFLCPLSSCLALYHGSVQHCSILPDFVHSYDHFRILLHDRKHPCAGNTTSSVVDFCVGWLV
jgi:hypothetical protein